MRPGRTTSWGERLPLLLSLLIVAFLAQFAWCYADERLYADSGYYLLRTILNGGFHIEHGRWVLLFAELPSLMGVKAGASMSTLILLHSLANMLFLLATMAYALLLLKDRRTALLIAMSQTIGLAHGMFCPVFELYYGVALVLLFHATATNDRIEGRTRMAMAMLLFIGALSSHPMAWVLLLGSVVLLDHRERRPLLIMLVGITVVFAIVHGLTMSTYEAAQIGFLQRLAFPSLVLDLFAPDTLFAQVRRVLQHYPDVLVLAMFTATVLWRGDRRRTTGIFIGGILGLYIVTGLYMPDATHDRYREQVDFTFTAWTLLVILSCVWRLAQWRPALLILLVCCAGYRMIEVASIAPYYEARTQWHRDLIAAAHDQDLAKAIIDPGKTTFGTADDHVSPYWSTGVESLLLSAKEGPGRAVSIITIDDAACVKLDEHPEFIVMRCQDVLVPAEMNERYFRVRSDRYAPLDDR